MLRRTAQATFVAVMALAMAISLTVPNSTHAAATTTEPVVQWNLHAVDALVTRGGQPPQQAVVHLAMVHGAVFDAVNAIDGGRQGYLLAPASSRRDGDVRAAVATAAHGVLVALVPAQQATLDQQYEDALDALPTGPARADGIAAGQAAATAMLAARSDDGRFGPYRFETGTAIGAWRPVAPSHASDPNAWLKDVTPFLVDGPDRFLSKGPAALGSRRYARDYAEVMSVGSATSTVRTADQTEAARYWAENPTGTWSRILRTVATQEGVGTVDGARLFAQSYMAAADSLITVWTDKARWSLWRPITAIEHGDDDGNRWTTAEPGWTPLLPTPPYPEHPSGLTALSGSMTETMRQFFHTDHIGWSDTSAAGRTRTFTRASEAVDEVVDARVWSGIHFRTADEQGADIARRMVQWQSTRHFRAINHVDHGPVS